MTVGVFANCTFCLKVKHLPGKQKKKLQTDIRENGGNISISLSPQCTHVISDSAEGLSQYQLNSIRKNHIHVASPDFIWECVKERRLLDVKNYDPVKSPDSPPPPRHQASSSEVKTDQRPLDDDAETESAVELAKFYTEDADIPHFPEEFEVAKYNTLEKVGSDGGLETAVVELQCSGDPGKPAFRVYEHFLSAGGTEARRQVSVQPSSADACESFARCVRALEERGFRPRAPPTPEAARLASERLQALLAEEVMPSGPLSPEVSDLVEVIWAEALGHLEHTLLGSVSNISLNDVSRAEGVLLLAKAALRDGVTDAQLQEVMSEFYRLIPHKAAAATEVVTLALLARKEDLCQLIRDMVGVCETHLSKPNPPSLAKYRALRCKIEHVEPDTEEFSRIKREVLRSPHSQTPVDVLQIFRVGRAVEAAEFVGRLGNVRPLLHGSPVQSFVGILSRGLLLPKVVEDRGVKRTDAGNLGSGIYFSDSLSTSIKYSHRGDTDGSRLLAVCDVALGRCVDLQRRDLSLTAAPPGYDSVHGVPGTAAAPTDFEDDEFVVYNTSQVKMKYVVKFRLPGDAPKAFRPRVDTDSDGLVPEAAPVPEPEDYRLPDSGPSSSVRAGLQDAAGNAVPLADVHIRGKIIDFVAQVVVFQTYTNRSPVPMEAKYVFPLDEQAAVCGFEAFINGKHMVGEIKEKEAAHREYREAVRQGHGAYLMDQDAPDVFTVSVGNLPPQAQVLIKITYITELSVQGSVAAFFLPATVAPWRRDKALNENTQDTVEKICVKEVGAKQSFSLSMSIEMPYVIEFVSSATHELKTKRTDCKAVIGTVDGSTLDSSGFSLLVGVADAYLPRMWVEKHPETQSEACMLVFHPDLGAAAPDVAADSEVVICLDCSNSMAGAAFLQAKQVALHALSSLGDAQKVNIVRFGSGYRELFPYPQRVPSREAPAEFLASASPTMGSTDFWKTLRFLSLLPPPRGLRNILLVSDGHLQSEGLTLRLAHRHARHTRLFCCGVGPTANRHVLRSLSQCGAGVFEYFNPKSKHTWKKQIEDQLARSRSAGCRSVSVKWQQLSARAPAPLQAPAHLRALFHGDRLLVYGFVPHCTQATLCALIQEKEFSTMVSTTELQKTTGTMIHKLTARALIRDYEDGMLHENETSHEMKKQMLKSLIIQLSKENCLITQFTSFVAVERRDGGESPFPDAPDTSELIAREDVDILPYVSWQQEQQLDALAPPPPLPAPPEGHKIVLFSRSAKKKRKTCKVQEAFEDLGFCALSCKSLEQPGTPGVERLSHMEAFNGTGIRPQLPEARAAAGPVVTSSFLAAGLPVVASPPGPPSQHLQNLSLCSAALPQQFHLPVHSQGPAGRPAAGFSFGEASPRLTALSPLPGPALPGPGLFGSGPFLGLPEPYKGPEVRPAAGITIGEASPTLTALSPFPGAGLFGSGPFLGLPEPYEGPEVRPAAGFVFGEASSTLTPSTFPGAGLFGPRPFLGLPEPYEGPEVRPAAGFSLESDSPPQPLPEVLVVPPLPGGLSLPFAGAPAPLTTSHKQPAHSTGPDVPAGSVSSDSPQQAPVAAQSYLEAECDGGSFGTESDVGSLEKESNETRRFLARSYLKTAKSGRRRGIAKQLLALKDEGDGTRRRGWRDRVPWTKLFSLQTEDGSWKLTPELGFILNINTDILNSFLEEKGIRSLGVKGRQRLLDLIATLLVLQLVRTRLEQDGATSKSLTKLDDVSLARNFPWAFEEVKKASEWVRRTEGQYPSICQRLELGKDWDAATKKLLGLQPINTSSPLHRVLNYGQG